MRRHAPTSPPDLGDDRRQHLQFLQDTIRRMAEASAVAKGWSLTVAVAALAYAWTHKQAFVALLGALAALLFMSIDARYLLEERKYRALFSAASRGEVSVYDMDARRFAQRHHADRAANCTWPRTIWSWSITGFHGWIVAAGAALAAWLQFNR